ncbi:hypothetical protein GGR26_000575 [Lewinella marina]|uniref:Mannosyl-glycoprotein endo-beta-N-acetylglucosamidase-like domain-containing protein n=1 Tax=Neolewinella marina TaxID=438751 RepID=A0A2G0CJ65_9BACT|nr:glucosaminidase domain-containing protein [Neolewinella marina]NJB84830.1 hypothetical protein [Neolewinella marina]PHL00014.1 hypothetical protein CGL56_02925 [Neolewinella marina]
MPARPSTSSREADQARARWIEFLRNYGLELILLLFILYVCLNRGLAVEVAIHDAQPAAAGATVSEAGLGNWFATLTNRALGGVVRQEERTEVVDLAEPDAGADDFNSVAETDDPAPHISNLTLVLSPDYGERKGLSPHIVAAKRKRVSDYLRSYAPAARREMEEFGIPASITLAQALLESNAGDSKLAVDSNNHFGIKCRTKCLGCTCRNYGDDTRYDMFRVFDSVADSYREHSILLTSSRYARLHNYGRDYRKWAHGLKACGYATDPRYAEKLITIIENLELDRYDALAR